MKNLKKHLKGFTLVELIIVITILAVLSTIAFISFRDYLSDARDANRVSSIINIRQALDLQKMKTRKYPTPSEAVSYTGGESEIKQGVINKEILSEMTTEPKDPSSGEYYTYSVSKNGKYYQIASQLENEVSYKSLIEKTYADDYESVKVVGNYRFDPSLPSLIVVPSSVNTSSGIFDPNVCFVIDEGENTLTTCNEKKSEMSLKDYDNSLVGYWDMETLSGAMLKDLSGNGNDGAGSGGVIIGGSGGIIGKATYFNSGSKNFISISDSEELKIFKNGITISNIFYKTSASTNGEFFIEKYASGLVEANYVYGNYISTLGVLSGPFANTNTLIGSGNIRNGIGYGNYSTNLNQFFILTTTYDGFSAKTYVNGKNIGEKTNKDFRNILQIDGKIFIGGRIFNIDGSTGYYFNGIIDDIKIYNRALSDDEILQQARIAGF